MTVPNLTPAAWAADAPAGSKLLPPRKRLLPKLNLIEMGIPPCNTIIKDNELDLSVGLVVLLQASFAPK